MTKLKKMTALSAEKVKKAFGRITGHFRDKYGFPADFEAWDEVVHNRDDVAIHNEKERREYVMACLEQMKDATAEVENLRREYNTVTSLLTDMEEIEALPEDEAAALKEAAARLKDIGAARARYQERAAGMSEADYNRLDALREETEEGIAKLDSAESYHAKVKQDLKHLGGEKDAYTFRRNEGRRTVEDLRTMMVICMAAAVFCVVLLLILQYGFQMNTWIGYILAAGASAISITVMYIKHKDAANDLVRVEKSINKIILLHNSVKIRYVNNNNLIEYLCIKYNVRNGDELKKKHRLYQQEKKRREAFSQVEEELEGAERDLVRFLRHYQLSDPLIWLHQTAAILDRREMVEVRHKLIIRRQSLRRRMDYNREVVAQKAQMEIKDLVYDYPQYTKEILTLVSEYEGQYD